MADFSRAWVRQRVVTCDDANVYSLTCNSGVINVRSALYGRIDSETCSQGRSPQQLADTSCFQQDTLEAVKKQCDGMKVCVLNMTTIHASDPCPGISKYLDTNYSCVQTVHETACEHSMVQLRCTEGRALIIYSAVYGRSDQTTCASGRPESEIQDIRCSRFSSKVAESCDGKNSCIISASSAVFGDPCVGTYKYLMVGYTCQDFSRAWSKQRVVTCDDASFYNLTCNTGVINVRSALYGRVNSETCSEGRSPQQLANTSCFQQDTLEAVKKQCDGRKVCVLDMTVIHASDPCPGISKYLDTTHSCFRTAHETACEHSVAHLHCNGGQGIFVYNANYGRHTHTICVEERSYPQIQNTHCISADTSTQIVAESCNGKIKCAITASNSVFGDPCVGTFKYLTVAYKCQCKWLKALRSLCFVPLKIICGPKENLFEGRILIVYNAVYGRSDRTTCVSGRPESEIQDVRCSRFSSKVAESCDGENSCVINASSAVFGDPCVGTYKYLTVDYTCQVPS
ncbi:rhamnose-binding lectin-like [Chaetodon auriga]|uniref:rhamnose-binding lectin-like n=1 Tax=Chaetodon auriga TaxID=39042 RepID=UPI004032BFA1